MLLNMVVEVDTEMEEVIIFKDLVIMISLVEMEALVMEDLVMEDLVMEVVSEVILEMVVEEVLGLATSLLIEPKNYLKKFLGMISIQGINKINIKNKIKDQININNNINNINNINKIHLIWDLVVWV